MRKTLVPLTAFALGAAVSYVVLTVRPHQPPPGESTSFLGTDIHLIAPNGPPGSHRVFRPYRYTAGGRKHEVAPQPADESGVWVFTFDGGRVSVAATPATPTPTP